MNEAGVLAGTLVDAVTFGTAHFQLRLSRNGEEFSLTSGADIEVSSFGNEQVDFRESKLATGLIELVGAELTGIEIDEAHHSALVQFREGQTIRAWWPDKVYDNLFVARSESGSEVWIIG